MKSILRQLRYKFCSVGSEGNQMPGHCKQTIPGQIYGRAIAPTSLSLVM